MKEILFTQNDIVGNLAFWILQQSKCIPANLVIILNDAVEWLNENEIVKPTVDIPDFICYTVKEEDLYTYLVKMVHQVPSIKVLEERSLENKNDFISLGALARNICNSIRRDFEITESIGKQ